MSIDGPGRAALAEDRGASRRDRRRSAAAAAARKVRAGGDVCILAVGKMVEAAEEAAALLDARGVHARGVGRPQRSRPTRGCSPTRAATTS